MTKDQSRKLFGILCVVPATILLCIFIVYPTIQVFYMSLFDMGGFSPTRTFVGLENFRILVRDQNFIHAMQNTILYILIVCIVTLTLAVLFASLLSRENIRGANFFRTIFYIPNILSIVVIAGIFSAIYNPTTGLANSILRLFDPDMEPILWLGDRILVNYSLIAALIWQAIGYYMVMYMAAMANIPESLYEAAQIDGANPFQQFFQITLPLIWNNIRTTLTFFVISTINLSFQLVKTMTGGGPNGASEVGLSYMYSQAYSNSSYGYGMAIGVVIFIFSYGLSAILSQVTKRDVLEY